MPKIIDYPRASLKSALELAKAVDDLGGTCSEVMAAERMGRKVSGAFNALTSSASKYGLVESKAKKLAVTPLYRDYKLSYTEEEKRQKLRTSMLTVPIFGAIYERFANKELPLAHFDKLLIREFNVPDDFASRVVTYFVEGARDGGMIDDANKIVTLSSADFEPSKAENNQDDSQKLIAVESVANNQVNIDLSLSASAKNYFVRIMGPGMDSNIEIYEPDDLLIVMAMLKKVEKALGEKAEEKE